VAENHQFHNAMTLVEQDAAVCIEEKDLTGERLWQEICAVTDDPARLESMAANVRKMVIDDADERIYRAVRDKIK
jgi:UDP-N-acetylglucosamine--N-acetylmuramyl-(pentapeptide) pyrophosphoryl-undecaprenol N-acetylglucosamine transferase